jgi:hypothetical protein
MVKLPVCQPPIDWSSYICATLPLAGQATRGLASHWLIMHATSLLASHWLAMHATCVLAFLRLALSGAEPPPPASWLPVDWTEREWGVVVATGRPPTSLQPGEEGRSIT